MSHQGHEICRGATVTQVVRSANVDAGCSDDSQEFYNLHLSSGPEHLKESLRAAGQQAQEAAKRTAEKQGVLPESMKGTETEPHGGQHSPGEPAGVGRDLRKSKG